MAFASSALFLLSALLGVWAAPDRALAWNRFALITVGLLLAAAVIWAGRWGGREVLEAIGFGCALLAGAIGGYFLLTYDWSAVSVVKFAPLQQAGLWIQANRPAIPVPEDIHPNMAGSALVILLPLGLTGFFWSRRIWWPAPVLAAIALLVGLAALVLSVSRGSWLALVVALLAALILGLRRAWFERSDLRILADVLAVLGALAVPATILSVAILPQTADLLGSISAGGSVVSRATLWWDGLALIADYPFTGSGLDSTTMVYSSYGRLLHVPYIPHMHNLFVQIAVEQGVFGLLGFLGMLIVAGIRAWQVARRPGWPARLALPASASLVALVVHGLTDTGIYGSLLVTLVFLPMGFVLGMNAEAEYMAEAEAKGEGWRGLVAPLGALAFVSALASTLYLPAGQAALQANLGAVAQSRAELAVYSWPEWPIQDELRRSPEIDLAPAIARYEAALAQDSMNASANRRLGQIELSQGDYASANYHLQLAYERAPRQRATRQLLGESYAVNGNTSRALALWYGMDASEGQLQGRQWWYEHVGEEERAQWIGEVLEALQ